VTPSERLRRKLALAAPALDAASGRPWGGPHAAALYPEYLASMYDIARGAVPLMERALLRCRELEGDGDDVAAGLAGFLEHHIPEEQGHDRWLLDDIAVLGGDVDELRSRPPSAAAAGMNGAQLWWIEHAHPVALLGHAEVLEGSPPTDEQLDEFEQRTGVPPESLRFFRRHAVIDPRHRDEIHTTLDALPLSAAQEALIGTSALHTVTMLIRVFDGMRHVQVEAAVI
jgi:heme oxygenase-like protein